MFNRMRLMLVSLAVLAGCATQQSIDTFKPIAQIAVMKIIESDRDHAHQRAVKIREFTAEGQQLLDSADFTVPLLEAALKERLVSLELTPSDRVLGLQIIQLVANELRARVGDGRMLPEQKYSVSEVFAAIEEAASFY
jgi:hypothetical protein